MAWRPWKQGEGNRGAGGGVAAGAAAGSFGAPSVAGAALAADAVRPLSPSTLGVGAGPLRGPAHGESADGTDSGEQPPRVELRQLLSEVVLLLPPCGAGASGGRVFRALWHGAPIAVKLLVSHDHDALQLTAKEALLSRIVSHPQLVQTYSVCVTQLQDSDLHIESYRPPGVAAASSTAAAGAALAGGDAYVCARGDSVLGLGNSTRLTPHTAGCNSLQAPSQPAPALLQPQHTQPQQAQPEARYRVDDTLTQNEEHDSAQAGIGPGSAGCVGDSTCDLGGPEPLVEPPLLGQAIITLMDAAVTLQHHPEGLEPLLSCNGHAAATQQQQSSNAGGVAAVVVSTVGQAAGVSHPGGGTGALPSAAGEPAADRRPAERSSVARPIRPMSFPDPLGFGLAGGTSGNSSNHPYGGGGGLPGAAAAVGTDFWPTAALDPCPSSTVLPMFAFGPQLVPAYGNGLGSAAAGAAAAGRMAGAGSAYGRASHTSHGGGARGGGGGLGLGGGGSFTRDPVAAAAAAAHVSSGVAAADLLVRSHTSALRQDRWALLQGAASSVRSVMQPGSLAAAGLALQGPQLVAATVGGGGAGAGGSWGSPSKKAAFSFAGAGAGAERAVVSSGLARLASSRLGMHAFEEATEGGSATALELGGNAAVASATPADGAEDNGAGGTANASSAIVSDSEVAAMAAGASGAAAVKAAVKLTRGSSGVRVAGVDMSGMGRSASCGGRLMAPGLPGAHPHSHQQVPASRPSPLASCSNADGGKQSSGNRGAAGGGSSSGALGPRHVGRVLSSSQRSGPPAALLGPAAGAAAVRAAGSPVLATGPGPAVATTSATATAGQQVAATPLVRGGSAGRDGNGSRSLVARRSLSYLRSRSCHEGQGQHLMLPPQPPQPCPEHQALGAGPAALVARTRSSTGVAAVSDCGTAATNVPAAASPEPPQVLFATGPPLPSLTPPAAAATQPEPPVPLPVTFSPLAAHLLLQPPPAPPPDMQQLQLQPPHQHLHPVFHPPHRSTPGGATSNSHTANAVITGRLSEYDTGVSELLHLSGATAVSSMLLGRQLQQQQQQQQAEQEQAARVLDELRGMGARRGSYLTAVLMEYCDGGTLLDWLKQQYPAAAQQLAPAAGGGRSLVPRVNAMQARFRGPAAPSAVGGGAGGGGGGEKPHQAAGAALPAGSRGGVCTETLLMNALEIAQGMAYLHSLSCVHGDLKPANVLLKSCGVGLGASVAAPPGTSTGFGFGGYGSGRGFTCKISDFGLTNPVAQTSQGLGYARNVAAQDSTAWGAVAYLAPEVPAGQLCKASDVYSYGAVLWHMATGLPPHHQLHPVQLLVGLVSGELQLEWPRHVHPVIRQVAPPPVPGPAPQSASLSSGQQQQQEEEEQQQRQQQQQAWRWLPEAAGAAQVAAAGRATASAEQMKDGVGPAAACTSLLAATTAAAAPGLPPPSGHGYLTPSPCAIHAMAAAAQAAEGSMDGPVDVDGGPQPLAGAPPAQLVTAMSSPSALPIAPPSFAVDSGIQRVPGSEAFGRGSSLDVYSLSSEAAILDARLPITAAIAEAAAAAATPAAAAVPTAAGAAASGGVGSSGVVLGAREDGSSSMFASTTFGIELEQFNDEPHMGVLERQAQRHPQHPQHQHQLALQAARSPGPLDASPPAAGCVAGTQQPPAARSSSRRSYDSSDEDATASFLPGAPPGVATADPLVLIHLAPPA
ncbi:hypothetical protein HXX76_005862 [Chlamydomonas incerta]|uniref:Protein kinase domain-containing protein n=1 Tax=Chlamydomonas incerta TaxID=51695 RepID=A0A835T1P5_CHLIN|nr:hypothetical protein HXX76_005862 [Chlamydomonas incerta]|eukprot:KAG2437198.1 hypothetical protein HXX76_005862 [Chlamydomonas incerta]